MCFFSPILSLPQPARGFLFPPQSPSSAPVFHPPDSEPHSCPQSSDCNYDLDAYSGYYCYTTWKPQASREWPAVPMLYCSTTCTAGRPIMHHIKGLVWV